MQFPLSSTQSLVTDYTILSSSNFNNLCHKLQETKKTENKAIITLDFSLKTKYLGRYHLISFLSLNRAPY